MLALELDHAIRKVVDADAPLVAVLHAGDLLLHRGIVRIVEVQTADVIPAAGFRRIRIGTERRAEADRQKLRVRVGDHIFQFVPVALGVRLDLYHLILPTFPNSSIISLSLR